MEGNRDKSHRVAWPSGLTTHRPGRTVAGSQCREVVHVGRGPSRFTRREFIRRSAVGGAALGVGGSLLAACSGKKPTSKNSGKAAPPGLNRDPETLIVATVSWSPDFDPASYFVNGPAIIDFSMYEGLIRTKLGT